MFRIKICGITNVADAEATLAAGADAIGLNFYSQSSRYVDRATARNISQSLGSRVAKVGVFVNAPVDEIIATYDEVGLDLIQLHGDERPEVLRPLSPRPVMKAFRVGPEGLASVRHWLETCMPISIFPKLVLIDAYQAGQYGGTGATSDWPSAAAYARTTGVPPLVLAGGLTPKNVAEAIRAVRPNAVDTAGGVENSPGRKDAALMKAFVEAARAAMLTADC
jgi:phosphoribosylanthranilate isomerase